MYLYVCMCMYTYIYIYMCVLCVCMCVSYMHILCNVGAREERSTVMLFWVFRASGLTSKTLMLMLVKGMGFRVRPVCQ